MQNCSFAQLITRHSAAMLLVFFCSYAPTLRAQFSSYTPLAGGGLNQPAALAVGDLNGDGYPDVLSASSNDNRIAWYRNSGGKTFSQQLTISTIVQSVTDAKLGDLDGDGDLDIVASSGKDSTLTLFFNDGAGQFTPEQTLNLHINRIAGVQLADLDQDTDLDIFWFASSYGADTLGWLKNGGDGQFEAVNNAFPQPLAPYVVQATDLDGDGDPDILIYDYRYDQLLWLPNTGNGLFGLPVLLEDDLSDLSHMLTADLNGDQLQEIVIPTGSGFDGKLSVFKNLGNALFDTAQVLIENIWTGSPIQSADLDRDGDQDILCTDYQGNFNWYINDGNGAFTDTVNINAAAVDLYFIETADIDLDGRPDIVTFGFPDVIEWLPNTKIAPFRYAWGVTAIADEPWKVLSADLNNDGFADLLVESFNKMTWFPNDGAGAFGRQIRLNKSVIHNAGMLEAGDLDGDGFTDFANGELGWGSSMDEIRWKSNDGEGNFGYYHYMTQGAGFELLMAINLTDLNNDQVDEVIYAAVENQKTMIAWFPNDGTGNFDDRQVVDTDIGYNPQIIGADLDGDGRTDLLVNASDPIQLKPFVFWYRNQGGGQFGPRTSISPWGVGYYTVEPVDLDADGDLDILARQAGQGILWFRNLGAGAFSGPIIINGLTAIADVLATDLDRDGDKDLIYPRTDNGKLVWQENAGNALFMPPKTIASDAQGVSGVYAADLDKDGYPDLVTWSTTNNTVGYYLNNIGRPDLSGFCFHDQNLNGKKDPGEQPLQGVAVRLEPEGLLAFSDSEGKYRFYAAPGNYTVRVFPHNCWKPMPDTSYAVPLQGAPAPGPDFGFVAGSEMYGLNSSIVTGVQRCGAVIPAWIQVENPNCSPVSGNFQLITDPQLTFVDAQPPPAAISGDTIWWNLDTIPPTQIQNIYLHFQVVGSPQGGILTQLIGQPNPLYDPLDPLYSREHVVTDTIRCSYDPNDKQVRPAVLPEQYWESSGELSYTIRFQNTGNDTAFLVRIVDTLSADLDWNTFRPVGASHLYSVTLHEQSGVVEFLFSNIQLPDSTTNNIGSQGYVNFTIEAKPGLAPGSEIHNRAAIYFDLNLPVITNTAITRVGETVGTVLAASQHRNIRAVPNPTSGLTLIELPEPALPGARLRLLNQWGQLLTDSPVLSGLLQVQLSLVELPPGAYLVQAIYPNGTILQATIIKI